MSLLKSRYFFSVFLIWALHRSSRPKVFCKMGVLRNFTNSQENICVRVSFLVKLQAFGVVLAPLLLTLNIDACNFIKKDTLAQVSSCEFCEISKSTFLHRTPLVAASDFSVSWIFVSWKLNLIDEFKFDFFLHCSNSSSIFLLWLHFRSTPSMFEPSF